VQWQLENRPHPEQGYRACLGLLNLAKTYGEDRLEAACRRALSSGPPTRKRIIAILKANLTNTQTVSRGRYGRSHRFADAYQTYAEQSTSVPLTRRRRRPLPMEMMNHAHTTTLDTLNA